MHRNKFIWLWQYYRRHFYLLAVLLIFTPIQAVFQVAIPRMYGFAVDFLQAGEIPDDWLAKLVASGGESVGLSTLTAFGWAFILLGLISVILYAYVQTHRAWMNCRLEMEFRQDSFSHTTSKGPDFFNKFRTGDLVTRMTDDVAEKLSWFACSGIFRLYEAILNIAFILVMMIMIDPVLTLWTAGPLPILILVFFFFSTALDKQYDHLQTRISRFNDVIEACFSGIRVVMAYGREKAQKSKFHEAAADRRQAEIRTVKIVGVVESLWFYIWQFALVIVMVAGGYMVINRGLSYGNMAVFIYYVVWLVFPMFDIGQFLVKSRQSAVSITRLRELEDMKPMVADTSLAHRNGDIKGGLSFDKVSFAFPESDRQVIEDVSLEVAPGETVALVGRIGSGKTWLVNMLPRLVDPSGGTITLDGRDLRQFSLEDLRRIIGYVPQEPALFSDTVRNNITFGRTEISDDELNWAVEVSQLKEEVAQFPEGLETSIGTRGMSISGGQKQRLGLARALVGKPKILVLDDCTSALDSRTETALWDRLHEVMPEMTSILITHRPDQLQKADRIFVLDDGRLVESGHHDELMAGKTLYASIYRKYQLEAQVNQ
ncbi:MAG: ABC transporter ATP-binding protein [bacterium]|nr:ABC transporter ATP-binding protein [bacterium]